MTPLTLADLSPHARSLARASLSWADQFWDRASNLLIFDTNDAPVVAPVVRDSLWYAFGLLLRDEGHDRARACAIIATVLDHQFDEPGAIYHGTFYRYVGEPHPPQQNPTMWRDYDPNWRQFVGTALAMMLDVCADRLPPALGARMERAIRLAVAGEPPDRCPPWYANIALMKAGLMTWAGDRFGNRSWWEEGETFGQQVYDLFRRHDAFYEYNSPTYYGVNLYALAFWRRHSRSPLLQALGADLEERLWRDIALLYHAGLRNLCGPYMRSYGMDMQAYASLLGMSIWLLTGPDLAPFSDTAQPFGHAADFAFGPCLAVAGSRVPDAVHGHFSAFAGERTVERCISTTPRRVITAWLGDTAMIGAEAATLTGAESDRHAAQWLAEMGTQYHPATVHWRIPGGAIGWMRLLSNGPVQARAGAGQLAVTDDAANATRPGRWSFYIHAPANTGAPQIKQDVWVLPG
ncbi:MAG: hypothetical protein H3C34_19945, partial [Caldilineaceae bacterium]|nr:hypothetical protein [Caldilineaceae bacterium]